MMKRGWQKDCSLDGILSERKEHRRMRPWRWLALAAVSLSTATLFAMPLLVGCGGGGDGSTLLTGQFVDRPVAGLKYSTATQSGETDADGTFFYQTGETVSFHVGDILIGQATGASSISPFDLAGITPPQSSIEIVKTTNKISPSPRSTPLEVATNIAVFLQTLDSDGDLSNGIQIPAQIHTLADGASVNFHQRWHDFPRDFSFRKLLAEGRSAGLWGGTRPVRNPAYALDSLYAGLGLTPAIYAVAVSESDFEGTVDSRATYTFDTGGNRTMYENDSDADGTVDSRDTYTYDANGIITMEEVDCNADGTVNRRYTYTYDADGNRTMSESDSDADGTVDRRYTYTFDVNGNQTIYESDSKADGTVDSRHTYSHQLVNRWMYIYFD